MAENRTKSCSSFHNQRLEFLRVLIPNPFVKLRIPRKVAESLQNEPHKCVTLYSPHGELWHVDIHREGNDIYLDKGWKEFAKALDLRTGYFVLFQYESNMVFSVKVFDNTMCLKEYVHVSSKRQIQDLCEDTDQTVDVHCAEDTMHCSLDSSWKRQKLEASHNVKRKEGMEERERRIDKETMKTSPLSTKIIQSSCDPRTPTESTKPWPKTRKTKMSGRKDPRAQASSSGPMEATPTLSPSELESAEDFGIHWNPHRPEHKERFEALKKRQLVPSRFIDLETVETLEIHDEVQTLTGRVGLWDFLSTVVPTYRRITFEFLATVEYDRPSTSLRFQLCNRAFSRTPDELNALLGFPSGRERTIAREVEYQGDMPQGQFMTNLFGGRRNTCKSTQISHPSIRYIQRVLANTLFGRGETQGTLNTAETFYIYCMLRRRNADEAYLQPHVGVFLIEHLLHIATLATEKGSISIGGVITKLARALGLDVNENNAVPVPGPTTLDLSALLSMTLITKDTLSHPPKYSHKSPSGEKIPFPLSIPLDPRNPNTWNPSATRPTDKPSSSSSQPQGPSNQLIYEQVVQMNQRMVQMQAQQMDMRTEMRAEMGRINARLDEVRAQMDVVDVRSFNTEYLAQQMHGWHVREGNLADQPPPRLRRRHQPPPPPEDPPSSPEDD